MIARCSIKTVRRAYAAGALTAYRRRGSRAVLLDNQDVLAWAQGQMLEPTAQSNPALESKPVARLDAKGAGRAKKPKGRPSFGSQLRFDLSADALRERRSARTQPSL
jgi:hypothetical protein